MSSINNHIELPLFPLPSQILPQGVMPLRIYEDKYIRLVKESFIDNQGFGVVMLSADNDKDNHQINSIGTRVEIIDFYQLEDGFLGITVIGKECFELQQVSVDNTGLKRGLVKPLPNWPAKQVNTDSNVLADKLQDVFSQYPQLNQLYSHKEFNNLSWLCQRWLEILPMPVEQKQQLIAQNSCIKAEQLLNQMIKD